MKKIRGTVVSGATEVGGIVVARRGSRISATHFPHGRCRTPRYLLFFFLLGLLFDCPLPFAAATSKKKSQPRQPSMRHSLQLTARGKEIVGAAASTGLPEMTWMRASTMMEVSCSAERRRWVEFFDSINFKLRHDAFGTAAAVGKKYIIVYELNRYPENWQRKGSNKDNEFFDLDKLFGFGSEPAVSLSFKEICLTKINLDNRKRVLLKKTSDQPRVRAIAIRNLRRVISDS
ncbi:hypothetical protein IEQ34_017943 [Dendrobium chrysotoxum]|uniref:Uncharacterized protein n=1 Tax=Dendrobium chrysotoxum TaxID=161865 RepID=A0AAV7GD70_DENCH|nr:hypothetical protein IEQ34_017943 [Dendrobium chrysotoxum]